MSKFRMLAIAALALLSANVLSTTTAWPQTEQQTNTLRQTYSLAMSSVHDVLEGVTAYSIARSNNNEYGMRRAAASMLGALAESRIWMALLDAQVTADDFGAEADEAISNLREMLVTTYDNLDDAFFSNDLNAINARLDDSSGRFNQLFIEMNKIASAVGPRIGSTQ